MQDFHTEESRPMAPDAGSPSVSVVIPGKNEAENLPELIEEIRVALGARAFEIMVIDDGSDDGTDRAILALMRERPWLRLVRHAQSCGQSAAVRTGLLAAKAPIVVTIDGDGQNDPAFMPALIDALEAGGPMMGIAAGQRLRKGARIFSIRTARDPDESRRYLVCYCEEEGR